MCARRVTVRKSLVISTACAAMAACVLCIAPLGVRADPGTDLEEVIVTARKMPEPLDELPLQIEVYRDDGGEVGVDSLQNLIGRAPGLYFESAWGGMYSAPTLRGQTVSSAGDLNVGVFVDGVYQANPKAIDSGPIDIERVELVRGPQSALFGHSTFAGAIHYVSAAPTPQPESGLALESGSHGLAGVRGYVSGPLFNGGVLGRLAIGTRTFDGAFANAAGGERLGGTRRNSLALRLATPDRAGLLASLSVRFTESRYTQPAVASLSYVDNNCGAIEPASGAWSYFCGSVPISGSFESSPGIPDSENRVGQTALKFSWPVGAFTLTSETSYYRANTDSYRDFDISRVGRPFGVCTLGVDCEADVGPQTLDRFVYVNEILRSLARTTEISQEIRVNGGRQARLQWSLGITAWQTRDRSEGLFGAESGDLEPTERLTALLPLTPDLVGPVAINNAALVADPAAEQVLRSLDYSDRRTLALFGSVDWSISPKLGARAELRATNERRELDNLMSNFAPGFGSAIPAQTFRDLTPRVSLQYDASRSWTAYWSAAKGSQSGGINSLPGLLPGEQAYEPEYNWTYELAGRYRNDTGTFAMSTTLYVIDWRDAQLLGFAQTPGVNSLIILNAAGIHTQGIEVFLVAQPLSVLRTEIGISSTRPEFRNGSDDPGSRRFCGLTGGNLSSTLCTFGPSRTGGTAVVPYVDGNVPGRVPRQSWHAAVELTPRIRLPGLFTLRVDANGQDDVYDRSIDGARFGRRLLIDARASYDFGAWSIALWGRNLGDERYVRALASRGPNFFPTSPRPFDALAGDGRSFGLSASFAAPRPPRNR